MMCLRSILTFPFVVPAEGPRQQATSEPLGRPSLPAIADRPQVDRLSAHNPGCFPTGATRPVVVRVGLITI
jgi:hypothetical protein